LDTLTDNNHGELCTEINDRVTKCLKTFDESFLKQCKNWIRNPLDEKSLISELNLYMTFYEGVKQSQSGGSGHLQKAQSGTVFPEKLLHALRAMQNDRTWQEYQLSNLFLCLCSIFIMGSRPNAKKLRASSLQFV
jgi:hypothetical protein